MDFALEGAKPMSTGIWVRDKWGGEGEGRDFKSLVCYCGCKEEENYWQFLYAWLISTFSVIQAWV